MLSFSEVFFIKAPDAHRLISTVANEDPEVKSDSREAGGEGGGEVQNPGFAVKKEITNYKIKVTILLSNYTLHQ